MSLPLTYWDPKSSGILRVRRGKSFSYHWPNGRPISASARSRIQRLVIPPAWTNVVICPDHAGHIQAVGRDARDRLQYRYHDRFRESQELQKFERLASFARALTGIRAAVAVDLRRGDLGRRHILAAVVYFLESTLIRVGNSSYAQNNKTYGLTTLLNRHAYDDGTSILLKFKGKSGKEWSSTLKERRIVRIIRKCQSLPGETLFQYFDNEGELRRVQSNDINDYLREISGRRVTAKDFRTWAGSALFFSILADAEPVPSETQRKKIIGRAVKGVAAAFGNTPAVCRRAYIHPAIAEAFVNGSIVRRKIPVNPAIALTSTEIGLSRLLKASRKRQKTRQDFKTKLPAKQTRAKEELLSAATLAA